MIVNLFAGPGGWAEGIRTLGFTELGIEWDDAACRTRAAAGHTTIRADVETYPPEPFTGRVEGLIASPPCQDFSVAGARAGRAGERGRLIDLVPVWVQAVRPRWVACEQVPPALDIWREHASHYRTLGYSVWAGLLNSADYGVPQTRQRAILVASLDRPALPPEPTHAQDPYPGLFGDALEPWVSMADALGWHSGSAGTAGAKGQWVWRMPATTIAGDPRITARCHHDHGSQGRGALTTGQVRAGEGDGTQPVRLTITEALTLQSFRPDYPLRGSRTKQFEQVGNAIPPLLAAHIVAALAAPNARRAAA